MRRGQPIAGATSAIMTLQNASLADRGWYHVVVTNASGSTSSVFMLDVALANPALVAWPALVNPPAQLNAVRSIASGTAHFLALKLDGTVLGWSPNSSGGPSTVPVGLTNVVGIAAGYGHSLALREDGTVAQWGWDGVTPPGQLLSLTGIVAISVGDRSNHSLALKADGTVAAWGDNSAQQSSVPPGLSNVVAIAAGLSHSLALRADGTVVAWGQASYGAATVPAGLSGVMAIAAGASHSLALKSDGTVVGWGSNTYGESSSPAGLTGVVTIACTSSRSMALKSDGTVVLWGYAASAELATPAGLNNVVSIFAGPANGFALAIPTVPAVQTAPVAKTATIGDYLTLNVVGTGTPPFTYVWKRNGVTVVDGGRLSGATTAALAINGVTADDAGSYTVDISNAFGSVTSTAASVVLRVPPVVLARPLSRLATVGQATSFTISVSDPGPVSYQWKRNGQIVAGATAATLTLASASLADQGFYEVTVANASASVTSVCRLNVSTSPTAGTTVVGWGGSNSSLTTVPSGLTDVVAVAAGDIYTLALKSDGTVTAWGSNNFAGTIVPAGLSEVVAIAVGDYFSVALMADGRLVSWGSYLSSTLTLPPSIRGVVAIAGRDENFVALKSDGTVLGVGLSSAVPADLNNVIAIAAGSRHTLALRSDGTVVAWGSAGGLLNGQTNVPAGLAGVVAIGAGGGHSLAVKGDGTVVAWGRNDVGQATVPAGLSDVIAVDGGFVHSIALRRDGTVVGWGRDVERQVSDAARLGGVVTAVGGEYHNFAIVAVGAPAFVQPPAGRVANIGETVTLTVKTMGAPLPALQWRRDGVAIPGATGLTLTVANAQAVQSGSYTVIATNSLGSVVSTPALLSVVPPALVTSYPLSKLVAVGQSVNFTIAAPSAVSCRWRRNGEVIVGATTATLSLASAKLDDRGRYDVLVTDSVGGTARSVAYLDVAAANGSVIGWGGNSYGQINVPATLRDAAAITASSGSSAVLRADGTIVQWGSFSYQVPVGLTGVVAIAAGDNHMLALKGDGTVVVWGTGGYGENNLPVGLANVVAIAAAGYNSIALKADGTVVRWGYDAYGRASVPSGLTDVVAIAAGRYHSLALKSDGTVVAWGVGNAAEAPPTLSDAVVIAAGGDSSAAVRRDGTLSIWGSQPSPPLNLGAVRAVSVSDYSVFALKLDRSVAAWGSINNSGQLDLPAGLPPVISLAAGGAHSLVLVDAIPTAPAITTQPVAQTVDYGQNATFTVAATGTPVISYQWKKNGSSIPNATTATLALNNVQPSDASTYTVSVQNNLGSVTSAGAALTVQTTVVSAATTATVGGSVTLSVNAPTATAYQWRYRGTVLVGETNAMLTLTNLSRGQNGSYDVVLATPAGPKTAHSYTLDVRPVVMPDLYRVDAGFALRFEQEGAGSILAALRLPDGKFLIGGDFTRLGTTERLFLARLEADGSVDVSYTPPVLSAPVRAITAHTDGKIYIGGEFAFVNTRRSGGLVRLKADLTVDPDFPVGQGFDSPVLALIVQPDGKVIVGGEFNAYGAGSATLLARLNTDASLDSTLRYDNTITAVRALRLQPDGKVLVAGGNLPTANSSGDGYVTRLLASGGTDWTWSPNSGDAGKRTFQGPITSLLRQPDGKWIIGGSTTYSNGAIFQRLTSDGADDATLGLDATLKAPASGLESVTLLDGGKFLVSGPGLPLSRLTSTGARDATQPTLPFAAGRIATTTAEPDGASRLWGTYATTAAATPVAGSAVVEASGGSFRPVTGHTARVIASVFDAQHVAGGRILVRGGFTHVNGVPRAGLVRLMGDGSVDTKFGPVSGLSLSDTGRLALRGDGTIWVHNGGALVRLTADGGPDSTFAPVTYSPGDLLVDHNGAVLLSNGGAGGVFGPDYGVRRLSAAGVVDASFSATPSYRAVLAEHASGRIVLAGSFSQFNGRSVRSPIRILADGTWDQSFAVSSNFSSPSSIVAAGDDLIYVFVPGSGDSSVSRLNSLGQDSSFSLNDASGQSSFGPPLAILPLPDGKILRSTLPSRDRLDRASWLLGRHGTTGALDQTFQVDGLDRLTTRLERMLLIDDGSVWLFGKNLSAFGVPQLGAMRLTVAAPVSIAFPPVAVTTMPGGTATFSVGATGTGPLSYQWYRNGLKLSGSTSAMLSLSNLTITDVARYTVLVTGPFGTATPPAVTLTGPNPPPTITTQPISRIVTSGHPATFSVVAGGVGPLTYQWRRSSYFLPGATNSTLTIPHASRMDAGIYDVVVADGLSLSTSDGVKLDVAPRGYPNALQIDPTFAPRFETAGGMVNAIVAAPNGKFIVSGDFTRLNGVVCPGLARVDENFQVDLSFVPPARLADVATNGFSSITTPKVYAVLSDGKILVTCPLPSIGDYPYRNTLLRLLPDGSIDPFFNASAEPPNVVNLAVQPDGRIIVLGLQISLPLPAGKRYVYRLEANGALDTSYSPVVGTTAAPATLGSVVVQPDGKAVFTCGTTTINGVSVSNVVRLTTTGVVDPTFALTGTSSFLSTLAVLPDGRLLAGGYFNNARIARLGVDGALESTMLSSSDLSDTLEKIIVSSDGRVWAGTRNSGGSYNICRLSAAGILEQKFSGFTSSQTWGFAPAEGGRLLASSSVSPPGQSAAGYAADGTLTGAFAQTEMPAGVQEMVAAPEGKYYVAGEFTRVNGRPQGRLARLHADGTLDPSFLVGLGFNASPQYLLVLPDGRLLVNGGGLLTYRNASISPLIRLQADGELDPAFSVVKPTNSAGPYGQMTLLRDGRILLNGSQCYALDGSRDTTFSPTLSGTFAALALPDGDAVVAGATALSGPFVARLRPDGGTRASIGINYYSASSIALQPDGKVLVAGAAGGTLKPAARRLSANMVPDTSFVLAGLPEPPYSTNIYRGPQLLLQEDGRVLFNDLYGFRRLQAGGTYDTSLVQTDVAPAVPSVARGVLTMLMLDDGRLVLGDDTMSARGVRRRGMVRMLDGTAPVITIPPGDRDASFGDYITFTASVSGPGTMTYQWFKNGGAISGATNPSLVFASVAAADAGSYAVAVSNSGSSIISSAALLRVAPPVAPVLTRQPRSQSVGEGQSTTFFVTASGAPAPSFQWRKSGMPIAAATSSSLTIGSAALDDAGDYSVVVNNIAGSVTSEAARLTVFPVGMSATHVASAIAWAPAGRVTITNTFTYAGSAPALSWEVLLPGGWSLVSTAGDGSAATKPQVGATSLAEWQWSALPESPVTFSYTLSVPANARRDYELAALVTLQPTGSALRLLAQPDPLVLSTHHSADLDCDGRLSLTELTRVIELYNTRNGTFRTGAYAVATATTEDGFAADLSRAANSSATLSVCHSADANRDGLLNVAELTRVIELYNTRSGTTRTGAYRVLFGSEDGFAPGP